MQEKFKKVVAIGGLLLFSAGALVNMEPRPVEAAIPKGYKLVSEQNLGDYDFTIYEVKHKKTGCHYTVTQTTQAISIEQMYIKSDSGGSSIPYCTKPSK